MLPSNESTLTQLLAALLEDLLELMSPPDDPDTAKDHIRSRSKLYGFIWNSDGTELTFVDKQGVALHEPFTVKDIGYSLDSLAHRSMLKAERVLRQRARCRTRLAAAGEDGSADETVGGVELSRVRQRPAQQRTTILAAQINSLMSALEQPGANLEAIQSALNLLRKLKEDEEENERRAIEAAAAVEVSISQTKNTSPPASMPALERALKSPTFQKKEPSKDEELSL